MQLMPAADEVLELSGLFTGRFTTGAKNQGIQWERLEGFFLFGEKNPGKQKEHMKIVADYLTSFLGGNIWGSYLTHCPIYFFVWGGEVEQCKGRSRCWFDITSKFQLTWDIDIEEVAVFWASIPVPCSTWECVFFALKSSRFFLAMHIHCHPTSMILWERFGTRDDVFFY